MVKKCSVIGLILCLLLFVGANVVSAANAHPEGQIVLVGTDIETLNPMLSESIYESVVLNGIFSQLIRMDEKGNLIPDLAVEVPTVDNGGISPDGKVFTFHLRKDAKWHDGKPVTAKDVVFTWEMIMHAPQVVSQDGFSDIERMETPNDYTVVMHLKEQRAAWLLNWAAISGAIIPAHAWKGVDPTEFTKAHLLSRQPIGSGPFRLVEWKPGSHVILEANKEYYGEGPYLAKFIYRAVSDSNTQLTMLKTGEADIAMNLVGDQYPQVQAIKRLQVSLDPGSAYTHMTFNLDKPLFKDKRVRQALNYALPRQLIVEKVLKGVGMAATTSTAPILWAYDDTLEPYPFDLEKAKNLLTDAGWVDTDGDGIRDKNGKPLAFSLSTSAGAKERAQIAQIAKQFWKEIGVDLEIKLVEATMLFGDILENRKFDMIMFGWATPADPDEFTLYHSSQIPTPKNKMLGQNYAGYVNSKVDELLEEGKSLLEQEERLPVYRQIQKIIYDELPMLYCYYMVDIHAAPKALQNWRPAPFTNGINWNVNQWRLTK
ncbi:MAG: hypothetical protein GX998_04720 [Firmicutes bacterium]|nr:hypothetical protein [Bacillota bacterium]